MTITISDPRGTTISILPQQQPGELTFALPDGVTIAAPSKGIAKKLGVHGYDVPSVTYPAGTTQPQMLATFVAWLGRPCDYVVGFGGQDNGWADFAGGVGWFNSLWGPAQKILWSIPLIVKQSNLPNPVICTLAQAAAGAYDSHWLTVLNTIAARDPKSVIRPGWEFNGTWYPWRADLDPPSYKGAFRHFVEVARGVSSGFTFMWCSAVGMQSCDPEICYPGDDVVDFIATDVYEFQQWQKGTPDQRWAYFRGTGGRGLDWLVAFAAKHGKPIAIPEWGTDYNDGSFIQKMHDWMIANNVVMQSFWDNNSGINSSFTTNPVNGALYKQLFQGF